MAERGLLARCAVLWGEGRIGEMAGDMVEEIVKSLRLHLAFHSACGTRVRYGIKKEKL